MIFVYMFIIGLPALLIFFIIKKIRSVRNIQKHGIQADALIIHVQTQRLHKGSMDILTLEFSDTAGRRYPAKATVAVGQYQTGQRMPISYLAENPAQYAFDNGKGYLGVLVFCILLLLFTIFASYKINEMVQAGNYQFTG